MTKRFISKDKIDSDRQEQKSFSLRKLQLFPFPDLNLNPLQEKFLEGWIPFQILSCFLRRNGLDGGLNVVKLTVRHINTSWNL